MLAPLQTVTENGFVELEPQDFCYIDEETSKTLELVHNNVDSANRKHSLMGYLNTNTSTTTGARLLREAITRPLCHLATIEHRLNCVEYLVNRVDTLATITNCIKYYGQGIDLDAVVPCLISLFKTKNVSIHIAEKRLDALTTLKVLAGRVDQLVAALEAADQENFNVYKVSLQDPAYAEIFDDISNVIDTEVTTNRGKRSKMFRIKQGVETLFDIARSTYSAAIGDLEQYVRELHKEDGLPWKLSFGETRGYYLSLSAEQLPKNCTLGPRYIRINKTRTVISCTTKELMQSNVRASVSYENCMKLAHEVLTGCLSSVINNINAIYKLVDVIGALDMITSFAKLVINSNGSLVRPKFTASDTVVVKSRHPVLESVLSVNSLEVVPNDIIFATGHKNFILVTGPNMGGKSIYLKQVGIIQIMAQLGCYVPAETAHIKLVNRIVARSGTSDDNHSSCSSFMWEMRGIATMLKRDENVRNQSVLYIIDEVGRGTSIDDGASYSFAIAEELASRRYCFSVFATHFDQVFSLTALYGNVVAYHFKYDEDGDSAGDDDDERKLKIGHKLVPGLTEKDSYGIKLAEACGLPEEIIRFAKADAGLQI